MSHTHKKFVHLRECGMRKCVRTSICRYSKSGCRTPRGQSSASANFQSWEQRFPPLFHHVPSPPTLGPRRRQCPPPFTPRRRRDTAQHGKEKCRLFQRSGELSVPSPPRRRDNTGQHSSTNGPPRNKQPRLAKNNPTPRALIGRLRFACAETNSRTTCDGPPGLSITLPPLPPAPFP